MLLKSCRCRVPPQRFYRRSSEGTLLLNEQILSKIRSPHPIIRLIDHYFLVLLRTDSQSEQSAAAHQGFLSSCILFPCFGGPKSSDQRVNGDSSLCLSLFLSPACGGQSTTRTVGCNASSARVPGATEHPVGTQGTPQHWAGAGWEAMVPNPQCARLGERASLPAQTRGRERRAAPYEL